VSTATTSKPNTQNYAGRFLDSTAFDQARYPCGWLIEDILVQGQPGVIGGAKKTLKTSLSIDMAISLGTGHPFLGRFKVPKRLPVAVMSGESGPATVQETARRICRQKNVRLQDCLVLWSFRLPRFDSATDLAELKAYLQAQQVKLVIIDPLYLCGLGQGGSASNLYEVGPLLRRVGQSCLAAGATPVYLHHTTKAAASKKEPLDLDDLAFAGIGEYARQWLLVSRREPFEPGAGVHNLHLSVGGSARQRRSLGLLGSRYSRGHPAR
jgi:replicative DNA helicase